MTEHLGWKEYSQYFKMNFSPGPVEPHLGVLELEDVILELLSVLIENSWRMGKMPKN